MLVDIVHPLCVRVPWGGVQSMTLEDMIKGNSKYLPLQILGSICWSGGDSGEESYETTVQRFISEVSIIYFYPPPLPFLMPPLLSLYPQLSWCMLAGFPTQCALTITLAGVGACVLVALGITLSQKMNICTSSCCLYAHSVPAFPKNQSGP